MVLTVLPPKRRKPCLWAAGGCGALLFAGGFVCVFVAFPALVDWQVDLNYDLWNKESEGYKNFVTPPVPIYMKFHFFVVANPKEVEAGLERPRLVEKGPYSYYQYRRKVNISSQWEGEDFIRFGQYKSYTFDAATSCEGCSDEDEITIINVALLGVIDMAKNLGFFGDMVLSVLNGMMNAGGEYDDNLYITAKVKDLLFDGVRSGVVALIVQLINLFGAVIPNIEDLVPLPIALQGNGFALFNGKQNTTFNEYYEINTGYSDRSKYFQIERWGPEWGRKLYDSLTPAKWWRKNSGYQGSNSANLLRGTDGQQFHPNIKEEETLYSFATDACCSLPFVFEKWVDVKGVSAMRFIPSRKALWTNFTEALGYCSSQVPKINFDECAIPTSDPDILDLNNCGIKDKEGRSVCNPDGIRDLSKCYGAPIVMSLPYFMDAPDFLRRDVDLVDYAGEDRDKHGTSITVEQKTGTSLGLHKRLQMNTPLFRERRIDLLRRVRPALHPIVWVDEGADLNDENASKLKKMIVLPSIALKVIQWAMVAVGALMVIAVYLLHSHGLLKRSQIEAPTKYQAATQNHQQQTASRSQEQAREPKRTHKSFWRPNVTHVTHNLAPVGASIQDAARNLRSRRFSVA